MSVRSVCRVPLGCVLSSCCLLCLCGSLLCLLCCVTVGRQCVSGLWPLLESGMVPGHTSLHCANRWRATTTLPLHHMASVGAAWSPWASVLHRGWAGTACLRSPVLLSRTASLVGTARLSRCFTALRLLLARPCALPHYCSNAAPMLFRPFPVEPLRCQPLPFPGFCRQPQMSHVFASSGFTAGFPLYAA